MELRVWYFLSCFLVIAEMEAASPCGAGECSTFISGNGAIDLKIKRFVWVLVAHRS